MATTTTRLATGITATVTALALVLTVGSASSKPVKVSLADGEAVQVTCPRAMQQTGPSNNLSLSCPKPTSSPSSSPSASPTLGPPTPTPTPGSQVVRLATPSSTLSTLQTWAADSSVDEIDFQSGTYQNFGTLLLKQPRSKLLTWRCQPGVTFDGGSTTNGAIHVATLDGPGAPAAAVGPMMFDLTNCLFQNYRIGSFGVFMTGWVKDITFLNAKVRGFSGDTNLSHVFYIESDQAHRGQGVTIQNADVVGPTSRAFGSGVQVYAHDTSTGTYDVHVVGGSFSNLNRFTYAYSDAIGFLLDGVTISNVNVPIEAPALPPLNQIQGIVRNTHATGSGANRWSSPLLTDGGGNSW